MGKKYVNAAKLVDVTKMYNLDEACELLKKTATTKFDSSCEVHFKLGVDTKQADQLVRATVALPHGTGKEVRVIAFVNESQAKEAKEAGAVKAGLDDLVEEILKGFMDFDVAVASPDVMKNLGKVAKTLGTKGLMPNPKAGTVTTEIGKTIAELKKGRVEFRTDKQSQIHNAFGKVSFSVSDLKANLKTIIKAIVDTKPSGVKGNYILGISVATTMGPGIKLDLPAVMAEL
ncbi:50S ribosomal protein L1 [Candidatus Peregrinibacteria bacterium]|nr:50S ribosomal protein L1 [Candidatus Peregrinibacteria bacterium]